MASAKDFLTVNRRRFIALGGAAAAASAFPAPYVLAQSTKRPDLDIGANDVYATLEPINAIGNAGVRITNAIFDTLIKRDFFADGAKGNGIKLVPGLATEWVREDSRNLLVTLRQGVKFHNGKEMTSEDVAYTFSEERLWGDEALKKIPNGRNFSPDWDEPEIVDRYTVRLRTKTPNMHTEKFLASWIAWVVPKEDYASTGVDGFGQAPIGTGPYKFVELRAADRVVLEPHDDYWGGRPTAGQIRFLKVAESASRVAGLVSGEYDMVTTLTPDDFAMLEGSGGVEWRGQVIENFHMGCFQQEMFPAVRDARIRRAIAMCINRPVLNETLWQGLADVPNGFNFDFYGASYDPNRKPFELNPQKAKALLDEAGYNGEPIEYLAFTNYYANHANALMMMAEWWSEIGLNVVPRLESNDAGSWGKVPIFNWSNGMQIPDAMSTMVTEFGPGRSVANRFGWQPPEEYGALCGDVAALADGPERLQKFNRMRDIFEEEMPALILYRPFEVYGVRSDIQWQPVSFEMMDLRPYNLSFNA